MRFSRKSFSPGNTIIVMLLPLVAIGLQIKPGTALLPFGSILAVAGVLFPLGMLLTRSDFRRNTQIGPLVLLWLWPTIVAFASVMWSSQAGLTLQRTLLVFVPGIALILLATNDPSPWRTFSWIARGLTILAFILSLAGIIILLVGTTRLTNEGFVQLLHLGPLEIGQRLIGAPPLLRISSLTGNPNSLATWLVFGLVLLPMAWPNPESKSLRWGIGIVITVALLLTMSRTGLASALIALLVFQVISRRRKILPVLVSGTVAILFLVILGVVVKSLGLNLASSDRLTLSLSDREAAWGPLVEAWQSRPFTGQGFGIAFEALLKEKGLHFGAHNGHLAVLAEIGLLGYLGIFLIWLWGIWKGWTGLLSGRLPSKAGATCLSLLFAYFAQQFFEASLLRFTFASFFWLYLVSLCCWTPQKEAV